MFKDKILLNAYKKVNKKFGGKGLTKYPLIRLVKNYALTNFRNNYAFVQGYKMILDSKDCLQLSINEIYEPLETNIIKNEIKNGDVVLDIGANIGYFTLLMANLVGINGRVFAFEPEPYNFDILHKNIQLNNYQNVIVEQKAVSKFDGVATLFLSKENTGMNRLNESKYCDRSIQVKTMMLDSYFQNHELSDKIKFIKIDVEGSEFDVLQGMNHILNKNKKIKMLLEFIPDHIIEHENKPFEILDFLTNNGFDLFRLDEKEKKIISSTKNEILTTSLGRNLLCIRS